MSIQVSTPPMLTRWRRSYSWKTGLIIIILLAGAILMIAPFAWITQAAFAESDTEVYHLPPRLWPLDPTVDNFPNVFRQVPFALFILNSVKIAGLITLGQLITCSTAAMTSSGHRRPGKPGQPTRRHAPRQESRLVDSAWGKHAVRFSRTSASR